MCGIVGYIGEKNTAEILIEGLSKLEYRGYDSSGIALNTQSGMKVYKAIGKLQNLKDALLKDKIYDIKATSGIGHTRWATHGSPSVVNAHPHTCTCGNLVIVHNGIIENFIALRNELSANGCIFKSQTDTEVVAHLIAREFNKTKDLTVALSSSLKLIKGAYALCVMHKDLPKTIVATRKNAPLIIGLGEDENFIASDVPAIISHTKKAIYLDDGDIATITDKTVEIVNCENKPVNKKIEILPWEPVALSKMGYKHFMLKEINEQGSLMRNVLSGKIKDINLPIELSEVKIDVKNLKRIQIIACGTSLHAAMCAKYVIEDLCQIPVDIEASSEYIYRNTVTDSQTLVIGVSQSGETTDTITAIRQAKEKGSHILIITNRPDSTMARYADSLIPVEAGIEVSVAATKSYSAQLIALYLLSIHIAEVKKSLKPEKIVEIKEELIRLPQKIETILADTSSIKACARKFASSKDFIFIARGINIATALEGALKLKEISYINATGYPAGELKHGPIAMLDESMPLLAIITEGVIKDKIMSNCEEAAARNAQLIAVASEIDEEHQNLFASIIKIPPIIEILSPALTVVPLQLLAYYISEFLGKDVDQPRNLAKSVTVE